MVKMLILIISTPALGRWRRCSFFHQFQTWPSFVFFLPLLILRICANDVAMSRDTKRGRRRRPEEQKAAKTTDGSQKHWSKKQTNKNKKTVNKQRNKNISTLPSKCHAGAQRLTSAARSNTVDSMLLPFLRAQKPTTNKDAFLTFTKYILKCFFFLSLLMMLMWALTHGRNWALFCLFWLKKKTKNYCSTWKVLFLPRDMKPAQDLN